MIRTILRWWRALAHPLPAISRCRCQPCLAFRRPGETEDHLCAAGCPVHGPQCPDCGLHLIAPR